MGNSLHSVFYVLAFWLLIYFSVRLAFKNKGNVVATPLYIMVRKNLDETFLKGAEGKRIYRYVMALFVVLTLISLLLFYYFILPISLARFSGSGSMGGLTPIIPGVTISGKSLVYLLINIGIAATIHELAHALIMRANGMKIKSAGFILAVVIPMAFVEPVEEEFREASLKKKVSVYSAGPASNLLAAVLFMGILSLLAMAGGGVLITQVDDGSPAQRAGMEAGFIIKSVNGTEVRNLEDFQKALGDYRDKEVMFVIEGIKPDGTKFSLTVLKYANESKLGIGIANAPPQGTIGRIFEVTLMLALWGYIVNISLAIINAAPLFITDGGRLISDVLTYKLRGNVGKALNFFIQVLTLLIILFSLSLQPIG